MKLQTIVRSGWVKSLLLVVAGIAGAATGLFLTGDRSNPTTVPALPQIQRFALTAADAKDQVEASSLAADAAGHVFLAWASKTGESERTVYLSRTTDSGSPFGEPRAVAVAGIYKTNPSGKGKGAGYERRATPHVKAVGDKVYLAWSESLPGASGMRMVLATSTDAGASFGPATLVHHGENAKPTFTSFTVGPNGSLACSWLDDRAGGQQPFASIRAPSRTEFEDEASAHAGQSGVGVCPCCPTAVLFNADNDLFVAFRNIDNGYRDIAVSRKKRGATAFEAAVPVVPPAWRFEGCPHDGPSLAITTSTMHIVWMDARSGPQRCWYARSGLDELKFTSRELNPIASGTQGNARLLADAAGGVHAVWEESFGESQADAPAGHAHHAPKIDARAGRVIMHAYMPAGAADFGPPRPVEPRLGAFQTRPAIVRTETGDIVIAWCELDESGKSLVVARMPGKTGTPPRGT